VHPDVDSLRKKGNLFQLKPVSIMPLNIEQYATYLDSRGSPWPAPPAPEPAKARPHLSVIKGLRAVLWNVYGTLLVIGEGELKFEVDNDMMMDIALDKTIQEFRMWNSMSRKPGQPSAYMREIMQKVLSEMRLAPSPGEKHPEISAERVWESIIKRLFQKEYTFDSGFYGSLNEFSKKVAYFFHASLQGTGCYPGAAGALKCVAEAGLAQGLLADGQCFTSVQLQRGLQRQDESANLEKLIPPANRWLSAEQKARKPSDNLFQSALRALEKEGIEANEVLHLGSSLSRDIAPAKKLGMRTGLFAGDRASLVATAEQLKSPQYRPDVLLTELSQVARVIG
jgi:FMN phosphatase YigB (HAD superfamily)